MSKRAFKSQASSERAAAGAQFGSTISPRRLNVFGKTTSLSYLVEPPDLSSVSDGNVKVALKKLQKKDATTKSKALEDLQSHFHGLELEEVKALDEGVLDAWVNFYPRLSIDVERRVRQLAHLVLGQIVTIAGKDVALHMPKVIGPWLAGAYDNDRLARAAAQESFHKAFPSEDKRIAVYRFYTRATLEHVRDSVLRESARTLSDERATSPDDAEAKYARVVATGIALLVSLLSPSTSAGLKREDSLFDEIIRDSILWEYASHRDPFVRASLYKLLIAFLRSEKERVSQLLPLLSRGVISNALLVDQTGSALEYSNALALLTQQYPEVWNALPEKTMLSHLSSYIKRGSQGSPSDIWMNIATILTHLPTSVQPTRPEEASYLMMSMRDGFSRREEPKLLLPMAWKGYFQVAGHLLNCLEDSVDQCKFVQESILPVFEQYARPHVAPSWPSLLITLEMCIMAIQVISGLGDGRVSGQLEAEWNRVATSIAQDMEPLSPERSSKSQEQQSIIATEGERWASMMGHVWQSEDQFAGIKFQARHTTLQIFRAAIRLLTSSNGDSHGAALLLESFLRADVAMFIEDAEFIEELSRFYVQSLPSLASSPSFESLLRCFRLLRDSHGHGSDKGVFADHLPKFHAAIANATDTILALPDSDAKIRAAGVLISALDGRDADEHTPYVKLEEYVVHSFRSSLRGSRNGWSIVSQALRNDSLLSSATRDMILSELVNGLSIENEAQFALEGTEIFAKQNAGVLKHLASTDSRFLLNILTLTESADEQMAGRAEMLNHTVESFLTAEGEDTFAEVTARLVREGLSGTGASSFSDTDANSIPYLVECAQKALDSKSQDFAVRAQRLFPDPEPWATALRPFLSVCPAPALAISDPMGSSFYAISQEPQDSSYEISYDSNGHSAPLRYGMYMSRMLTTTNALTSLDLARQIALLTALLLTLNLANDNVGLTGANRLWNDKVTEESEILAFLSESHKAISSWLNTQTDCSDVDGILPNDHVLTGLLDNFRDQSKGLSSCAFYNARAMAQLTVERLELYRQRAVDISTLQSVLASLHKTTGLDFFTNVSILISYRGLGLKVDDAVRACNELISQLTGAKYIEGSLEIFRSLMLLNLVLQWDNVLPKVPQHRLVLFVKNMLGWVDEALTDSAVALAEIARTLSIVLPSIRDVYGSHWQLTIDLITKSWSTNSGDSNKESHLPLLYATLKLYAMIRDIHTDNDDADDAWKSATGDLNRGLTELVKRALNIPDESHQPLRIVNGLLGRLVASIPFEAAGDVSETCILLGCVADSLKFYPLLYAESSSVQQLAYGLLHRWIPSMQEQISIDVALSKTTARLPEELISLVIEVPGLSVTNGATWKSHMPLSLRGYLFSWSLVFDHFSGSSFKVRSDYAEQLKEGNYVSGLLDTVIRILGDERGNIVDASGFNLTSYTVDAEPNPQRDARWLAVHLYYLTLKNLPALAKAWWIDAPRRQATLAVESWTEKCISPLLVADELGKVKEWVESGAQQDDENMQVRVSLTGREVTASYEVDEQTMQIVVRLPGAYPLHQVAVEGVNRIGVDERKWRSWLLGTQGVITFSNGSIIDGLTAWRRNVTAALKGQTECAICYSIISMDKQLPSKKCNTCKNLFHSGCLYKWFKSSNSSSCPLCRNAFDYG